MVGPPSPLPLRATQSKQPGGGGGGVRGCGVGGDPAALITRQSSRCILALVSLFLDLHPPWHDPTSLPPLLPRTVLLTPLNTH